MKKIFKIICLLTIAVVLIIPVRAEGENEDSGEKNTKGSLKIDTELNSAGGKKSSYVDEIELYNLFVIETENKINKIQHEEISTYKQEKDMIFQRQNTSVTDGQEYRSLLFQLNQTIKNSEGDTIRLEAPKKQISTSTIVLGAMGLTVMVLSVSFTLKKRRDTDE